MSVDSLALFPELQQVAIITPHPINDSLVARKLEEMKKLTGSINQINQNRNGVCDTCVTGYQSAIIENRLVAEQLSKETNELENKLQAIVRLKSNADKVISILNIQGAELNTIVSIRRSLIRRTRRETEVIRRSNVLTARY